MNSSQLIARLEMIVSSNSVEEQSAKLVEDLKKEPGCFDAIEPILWCMEKHSGLEFGSPGPLVHFLESFYGKGYEQKLIESIQRKPTTHTVWMLNRVINGAKNFDEKRRLLEILKAVERYSTADIEAKREAAEFLKEQRQKGNTIEKTDNGLQDQKQRN
jgi:hypothetical protein